MKGHYLEKEEISAYFEEVTPSMAESYLKHRMVNRTISQKNVAVYAEQMRLGNWDTNGESLKFDDQGHLIDGQHRLMAVVKSRATVCFLIVEGVDLEAMASIDVGRKRTLTDYMKINQMKYADYISPLVSRLWNIKIGKGFSWQQFSQGRSSWSLKTFKELTDYVEKTPEFQNFFERTHFLIKQNNRSILKSPQILALFCYYAYNPMTFNSWVDRLKTDKLFYQNLMVEIRKTDQINTAPNKHLLDSISSTAQVTYRDIFEIQKILTCLKSIKSVNFKTKYAIHFTGKKDIIYLTEQLKELHNFIKNWIKL